MGKHSRKSEAPVSLTAAGIGIAMVAGALVWLVRRLLAN